MLCLPPLLSSFGASLWSVLTLLLLTHPGCNYVQKLVNRGHSQDHRQCSAGTVQVLCLPQGLSRTWYWPSWVCFLGKETAHCRAINPGWESKIWPLPASQGEVETLEPEVLVLPHPAFCLSIPCARHSVGT